MNVITRYTMVQDIVERWERQYPPLSASGVPDKHKITAELRSLKHPIDPDVVDKIIGNKSWSSPPKCSCCDTVCSVVVEFGEDRDSGRDGHYLCRNCAAKIFVTFKTITDLQTNQ